MNLPWKISSICCLDANQKFQGIATLGADGSGSIDNNGNPLLSKEDLVRLSDSTRNESVSFRELLSILGLAPGAAATEIKDRLKQLIGRSCKCLSALTPAERIVTLGVMATLCPPTRTGLDRVKHGWRAMTESSPVQTFAAEPALDLDGDTYVSWQEMAAIAGHPDSTNLKPADAHKFVEEQIAAGGNGLVTYQQLGGWIGMKTTATKDEIIARFKELAGITAEPVTTLSAQESAGAASFKIISLGVKAMVRCDTRSELNGAARAGAAWANLRE